MAGVLPSGHTTKEVSQEEKEEYMKDFDGFRKHYYNGDSIMRAYPGGWLIPSKFHKYSEHISNFQWKPDDTLIVSYAKSGTNWAAEIVWAMQHNKNFDFPEDKLSLIGRCPFLEYDMILLEEGEDSFFRKRFKELCPGKDPKDGMFWQIVENLDSPRVMFTHLPISLFKNNPLDTCRVLYLARNPKDVLMSAYHFYQYNKVLDYKGDLDKFLNYFMEDKIYYSPILSHVKEAWALRDHPRMLFMFYEELKRNSKESYKRINDFIQAGLNSSQIEQMIKFTSFESMKNWKQASGDPKDFNKFFRKGETGSYKDELTPEQIAKLDSWIKTNTEGTGLQYL